MPRQDVAIYFRPSIELNLEGWIIIIIIIIIIIMIIIIIVVVFVIIIMTVYTYGCHTKSKPNLGRQA